MKFFDTFEVIEDEGQNWSHGLGYSTDTLGSGFTSMVTSICSPGARPTPPDYALGVMVYPFVIVGNQRVPVVCAPEDLEAQVRSMMAGATEYRISQALWAGIDDIPEQTLYLKHGDIATVPRTAGDYATTLAAVLQKAYEKTPHIRPVVHLGWHAAIALQFGLQNLKLPFVVPPGYPSDAIAVTGPVQVRLTPIKTTSAVEVDVNRKQVEATRFAAVEFDPTQAVRAAD